PTVSGKLHVGHVFSYTQTDIIARYKRFKGFSVLYPFGFDDNGLPTERYVESTRNVQGSSMDRAAFIELCLEETHKAELTFKELWQKIGLSVDWDHCYSTISSQARRIAQASFIELYRKGFVYRAEEPILYCTVCRTAVAQAELDDQEKDTFFYTIAFETDRDEPLLISTTRPELLSSCVALFYHPSDERYASLKGQYARVPLFNHMVPILSDELVVQEKGTGLVMCCTFGDKTDIIWFKKHGLAYRKSIDLDGRWTAETGFLAGASVLEARTKIVELLKDRDLIVQQTAITHVVNVHERCKKEIEYTVIPQWFIKVLEHKEVLLNLADQVEWNPYFMKARYTNWVANLNWDWCISRQRYYGVPFPVWYCSSCSTYTFPEAAELPIDPTDAIHQDRRCSSCKKTGLIPDVDVMDTWNVSSLTPYICYEMYTQQKVTFKQTEHALFGKFFPMSMRPQAHDIIRTWAFYTIVKAWMHHGTIPWNSIVISGHVLTDSKKKISKSKQHNVMDPQVLLKTYSADVIRYWTAVASLGQDLTFSEQQLQLGNRLVTKLWNAFRFIETYSCKTVGSSLSTIPISGVVNQWILHEVSECFELYSRYFESYEFSLALEALDSFFWNSFCDMYLECIKHALFHPEDYPSDYVAETRATLYQVGMRILQLYAPYVPHITEYLYQAMYKDYGAQESLHIVPFSHSQIPYVFDHGCRAMKVILQVVTGVRKAKTQAQLPLNSSLDKLIIYSDKPELFEFVQHNELLVKGVTKSQEITYRLNQKGEEQIDQNDKALICSVRISSL
ncbi:MAG: valine--tRNA ligase, partial [Candidatus Babeliales bacterium]